MDLIRVCGDKFEINRKMSKWGIVNEGFTIDGLQYFYLQPFCFARYAGVKLVEFCNEYLRLMGFSKFINSLKANDPYLELMKIIQDSSLVVWESRK